MQSRFTPGDRVRTTTGDPATVIRSNRLDPDKSVIWPDRWGQLPKDLNNGPGMCLRNDTLRRLAPPSAPQRRQSAAPNPSLGRHLQPIRPPEGLTR
jgi:hypothetical protein